MICCDRIELMPGGEAPLLDFAGKAEGAAPDYPLTCRRISNFGTKRCKNVPEASMRRGVAGNLVFACEARHFEMHVGIDEARNDDTLFGIE
jgi:hypothetical protein